MNHGFEDGVLALAVPAMERAGKLIATDNRQAQALLDFLSAPITLKRGLTGAKPKAFCVWVLDLMAVRPGDDVLDVFPGTGVMAEAVADLNRAEVG